MNSFSAKKIVRAGVISAAYAVLCFAFSPISYGFIQFRISECMAILPLFYPEAVIGLTVGCLIANVLGNGILDIVFGTLATFLASLVTYYIGKKFKNSLKAYIFGILPPILLNAFIVPFTYLALAEIKSIYFISAIWVGLGETGVLLTFGLALYFSLKKIKK